MSEESFPKKGNKRTITRGEKQSWNAKWFFFFFYSLWRCEGRKDGIVSVSNRLFLDYLKIKGKLSLGDLKRYATFH